MPVCPLKHLRQNVEYGFSGGVAVAFMRNKNKLSCSTIPFDGLEQPLGLDWKRPRIVVCFSVDQQDRHLDSISIAKRRYSDVNITRIPERSSLTLKSERRQRAIIRAAASIRRNAAANRMRTFFMIGSWMGMTLNGLRESKLSRKC